MVMCFPFHVSRIKSRSSTIPNLDKTRVVYALLWLLQVFIFSANMSLDMICREVYDPDTEEHRRSPHTEADTAIFQAIFGSIESAQAWRRDDYTTRNMRRLIAHFTGMFRNDPPILCKNITRIIGELVLPHTFLNQVRRLFRRALKFVRAQFFVRICMSPVAMVAAFPETRGLIETRGLTDGNIRCAPNSCYGRFVTGEQCIDCDEVMPWERARLSVGKLLVISFDGPADPRWVPGTIQLCKHHIWPRGTDHDVLAGSAYWAGKMYVKPDRLLYELMSVPYWTMWHTCSAHPEFYVSRERRREFETKICVWFEKTIRAALPLYCERFLDWVAGKGPFPDAVPLPCLRYQGKSLDEIRERMCTAEWKHCARLVEALKDGAGAALNLRAYYLLEAAQQSSEKWHRRCANAARKLSACTSS